MNIQPLMIPDKDQSWFRNWVVEVITSSKFEVGILVCILLNTVILAINWYDQPKYVDNILSSLNYFFAAIFTLEAILKLIAFGIKGYFRDNGNVFDFVIVLSTLISTIISMISDEFSFGASTTFIRAMRISRIFKFDFIKKKKAVKVIFETVLVTLPALTNIGGLLLLFLYIFSVLGVFLFADVKL